MVAESCFEQNVHDTPSQCFLIKLPDAYVAGFVMLIVEVSAYQEEMTRSACEARTSNLGRQGYPRTAPFFAFDMECMKLVRSGGQAIHNPFANNRTAHGSDGKTDQSAEMAG
jgi:hypothetical protein